MPPLGSETCTEARDKHEIIKGGSLMIKQTTAPFGC